MWLQKRKHDGDDDVNDVHKHKKSKVVKDKALSRDELLTAFYYVFLYTFSAVYPFF